MQAKNLIIYLILAISIFANIYFIPHHIVTEKKLKSIPDPKVLAEKYPFLSKKILTNYDNDIIINFSLLRDKLNKLITQEYGKDFAMYFEYLPTGTSIGINEKTEFFSASLLKVPTVVAYYHNRERNKITEYEEVEVKQKHIDKSFGNLWQKEGQKINLQEAVELTLIESDNTAFNLLRDFIDGEDFEYVFAGLDLKAKYDEKSQQISFTTKTYSSILKALYFSSLLEKENSEYILSLLVKSKFKNKLAAGIPKNVPVANKIGVYEGERNNIYSDCGIIYLENRTYLLCMASHSDEKTASERMSAVSKLIYDFVSKVNTSE